MPTSSPRMLPNARSARGEDPPRLRQRAAGDPRRAPPGRPRSSGRARSGRPSSGRGTTTAARALPHRGRRATKASHRAPSWRISSGATGPSPNRALGSHPRQRRQHVEPGLVARGLREQCAAAEIRDAIGRRHFLHDLSSMRGASTPPAHGQAAAASTPAQIVFRVERTPCADSRAGVLARSRRAWAQAPAAPLQDQARHDLLEIGGDRYGAPALAQLPPDCAKWTLTTTGGASRQLTTDGRAHTRIPKHRRKP